MSAAKLRIYEPRRRVYGHHENAIKHLQHNDSAASAPPRWTLAGAILSSPGAFPGWWLDALDLAQKFESSEMPAAGQTPLPWSSQVWILTFSTWTCFGMRGNVQGAQPSELILFLRSLSVSLSKLDKLLRRSWEASRNITRETMIRQP